MLWLLTEGVLLLRGEVAALPHLLIKTVSNLFLKLVRLCLTIKLRLDMGLELVLEQRLLV
jgi:hypothetical protein